jgi:hypothetical protein
VPSLVSQLRPNQTHEMHHSAKSEGWHFNRAMLVITVGRMVTQNPSNRCSESELRNLTRALAIEVGASRCLSKNLAEKLFDPCPGAR